MSDQTYLTRQEAAEYLRISVPQLDVLTRDRKIRKAKFGANGGNRVIYRRVDLDSFVEAHLSPEDEAIDAAV